MATKPTVLPEWNSGETNNVEPNSLKKGLGWEANEKPVSSSFFNWWMNLVWKWVEYLNDGVITTATTNAIGWQSTGNGTGSGLKGIGGATSGDGVLGVGGAPNGVGVDGQGTGTGSGVYGLSGSGAGAAGVVGDAKASSNNTGVKGSGDGTGHGMLGTAGNGTNAYGVRGIAGSGSGSTGVRGEATHAGNAAGTTGRSTHKDAVGTYGVCELASPSGGTDVSAGLYGVGIGGAYGVVAEANSSDVRSAFRIVPQANPPTNAQMGDFYVNSGNGKLYICTVASTTSPTWVIVGTQS